MRKYVSSLVIITSFLVGASVFAQGMMGGYATPPVNATVQTQTAQDETAGQTTWEKLQAKQVTCADLKDEDFDKLGDYFMGLMMGSSHAFMNEAMTQRLGAEGETQMHVAMGKRMSGCDVNAAFPAQGAGFYSMMGGLGGFGTRGQSAAAFSPFAMMGTGTYGGNVFIIAHVITMILVWALMTAIIIALMKWTLRKK